ncbi:MAG: hypothetical protein ABI579_02110 [Candidatus Sumerlaeota bacterium]
MEKNKIKPPQDQGTRPSFELERGDRERPQAGISGKLLIAGMGAVGGGLVGVLLCFFVMARMSEHGFNPSTTLGYTILGGAAILGAIAGVLVMLSILREEASN